MGHYQDDYDCEHRPVSAQKFSREKTGIPFAPTQEQLDQLIEQLSPAVGDVNSDAKGTGARYNADKTPYDMLPIQLLLDWLVDAGQLMHNAPEHNPAEVLSHLGAWQQGDDDGLDRALAATCFSDEGESLIQFAEAARVFQHVTTRPVKPYPKWNWMKGMAWSVPLGCVVRHLLALQGGEALDPETGISHWGHVQCNLIMLLHYRTAYPEGDDRPSSEWY